MIIFQSFLPPGKECRANSANYPFQSSLTAAHTTQHCTVANTNEVFASGQLLAPHVPSVKESNTCPTHQRKLSRKLKYIFDSTLPRKVTYLFTLPPYECKNYFLSQE